MIECLKMKTLERTMVCLVVLLFLAGHSLAMGTPPEKKEAPPKPLSKFELPLTSADWPTFHGNNARDGYSAEQYIKPPLQVRWGYATGGNIWSSPTVVAGTLFVGSSDGKLYSLNANDGTLRWSFKTGNAIFSSPAIEKATVYFGSTDSMLYALDADTGALKWYYETDDPVTSSPCIENGIVYFVK